MKLELSELAVQDLDGIYDFIANRGGVKAADRVIDAICRTCDSIAGFPGMGTLRFLDSDRELRSIPEGEYLIVYEVQSTKILVVRLLHGAMDVETILSNE